MRRVMVESPYRATEHFTVAQHRQYLRMAMADCIRRFESPMASHHLLPEILNDDSAYERALGIEAGFAWGIHADLIAVYSDLGVSRGMSDALAFYKARGKPIEWRTIDYREVRRIRSMC
jgi:hypothetical protein